MTDGQVNPMELLKFGIEGVIKIFSKRMTH